MLGTDDQLYVCNGDCAKTECITCPVKGLQVRAGAGIRPVSMNTQFDMPDMPPSKQAPEGPRVEVMKYGWPTFAPDGSKLAYSWMGRDPDGNQFGISVYDFAKHYSIPIFASRNERIDYVFWTPDGKIVSFLLGEPEGLSLILAEVKEKTPVRMVLSGLPIYYDWNRTADRLVVHTNNNSDQTRSEHVTLMSVSPTSQDALRTMSRGRLPFKTPCWSPDGKHLAYIANNNAESYLVVAEADGTNPKAIASLPIGESSFIWAPDSRHIAYSSEVIGADSVLHGIRVVDITNAESKRLTGEDVAAYFYSPDGKYLAYIAVPPEQPFYQWELVDLKTGKTQKARHVPRHPGRDGCLSLLRSARFVAHHMGARLQRVRLRRGSLARRRPTKAAVRRRSRSYGLSLWMAGRRMRDMPARWRSMPASIHLSRVFSRERLHGTIVAPMLATNRAVRVRVL